MNISNIPKDYVSPSERVSPLPRRRARVSIPCFVVGAVVGGIVFAVVFAGMHLLFS